MRVWVELGTEGAARGASRGDIVVVVDALRASVTITAALTAGARAVIPVETVEEAMTYRERAGFYLAGERHSVPVPGFDFGNSPTELLRHAGQLVGNVVVLTTSHGTRCVQSAREGASAVLVGSLPNASAAAKIAYQAAQAQCCDVTLVAAGIADGSRAEEDDYAVAVLAGALADLGAETRLPPPSGAAERAFQRGAHGQRLIRLGYGADVDLCASLDVFGVAGVLRKEGFFAIGAEA
jgi:phosphosulfolactate phosphohydrolase-like enzyme